MKNKKSKTIYFIFYYLSQQLILQMEIPLGNFFQVTINSNKLYSFIEDISKQIAQHQSKISELAKLVTANNSSTDEKINNKMGILEIQIQKVKKTHQQDTNYLKLYIRDVDKKMGQKTQQLQDSIGVLSHKINTTKQLIEDDFAIKFSYLEKKINNLTAIEELESKMNEHFISLTGKIQKIEEQNKNMFETIEGISKRNEESNENLIEMIMEKETRKNNQYEVIPSMRSSFKQSHQVSKLSKRERKKNHKDNICLDQFQQEFYNVVAEKVDNLELKLEKNLKSQRKSLISHNKIIHVNSPRKDNPKSKLKPELKIKEFQENVISKLKNIETMALDRMDEISKDLIKINNKNQIIDEHIGILSRKLQKQKFRVNEVTEIVRNTNEKKIDEKVIQNLKLMIKRVTKEMEEALELKLNKQIYQKEKQKNYQKVCLLNELVVEKAEKAEVKKGLGFLEEKIKEIIIVLAEERAGGQDGAVKKTMFKCLSCDKDLEAEKSENGGIMNKTNKENSSTNFRSTTNQMRKRIRMINNTVSTINGSDD